jgi:hypothetical protein
MLTKRVGNMLNVAERKIQEEQQDLSKTTRDMR